MTEPAPNSPAGWASDLPTFRGAEPRVVRLRLADFVRDAGPEQLRAWDHWIPDLQEEAAALLDLHASAQDYGAILEYQLPRDFRRPDVIVLEQGLVVVLELKGNPQATRAGLDQVLAYARDLRAYHAACHDRPVIPVLVPASEGPTPIAREGAWIVGPRGIHALLAHLARTLSGSPLQLGQFLAPDAYQPLPTIVQAARTLFAEGELPFIRRARASTDPALNTIATIAREAAATRTRHLVLLSGVPGSGKTLVGLQLVHAHWLDDLAVPRANGRPTAPAVFLSGNGPLVAVLQDTLRSAGGGGRTFVQGIKQYVQHYSRRAAQTPPEHLVVFDEAQRAHDAERVAEVHGAAVAESEPEHLLKFLRRVPDWAVLVALIGNGQAIHAGEEGGLRLWREALDAAGEGAWTVHAAAQSEQAFLGASFPTRWHPALNLDTEIRHHLVPRVHQWVAGVLEDGSLPLLRSLADELHEGGFRLLATRDLEVGRRYLRERYGEAPLARYGLVASSKDKVLPDFAVDNTFQTTKRLRVGPWFNAEPRDPASCCRLTTVGTEFVVQGLELDMALLAWGSDLLRRAGTWSMAGSRGTRGRLRDPLALRRNVYRVLLTRGRDGTVLFVPPHADFDETMDFLLAVGVRGV